MRPATRSAPCPLKSKLTWVIAVAETSSGPIVAVPSRGEQALELRRRRRGELANGADQFHQCRAKHPTARDVDDALVVVAAVQTDRDPVFAAPSAGNHQLGPSTVALYRIGSGHRRKDTDRTNAGAATVPGVGTVEFEVDQSGVTNLSLILGMLFSVDDNYEIMTEVQHLDDIFMFTFGGAFRF